MDWDSKLPPCNWDISDLEQPPMSALSPGPFGPITGPSDCSIDLKLGGGSTAGQLGHHRASVSGTVKRARGPGNQAQLPAVCCSVDGCDSDLRNCRDYHRRHKVCEAHSKTPVVVVAGQEQRFCQQCSRFHMLSEFDEVKRSCRKRLDGHNRRRRKPQSDTVNNPSLFSASHQGSNFSNFPTIFPATLPDNIWARSTSSTKASQQTLISHHHYLTPPPPQQQPFSLTFPQGLKEISKRFPFVNEPTPAVETGINGSGSISRNPIPISVSVSSESSGSSSGGVNNNANRMCNYSERALSLLSSPPPSATVAAAAASDPAHDQPFFFNYQYAPASAVTCVTNDGGVFMSNSNSSNGIIGIGTTMGFHNNKAMLYNARHDDDEGPSVEDGPSSHVLQFWHQQ